MPRYFYTGNATRPYRRGGFIFTFESIGLVAGQRPGILEVSEDKAAEALAGFGPPVEEVTGAEFEALKKNGISGDPSWRRSINQAVPASASSPSAVPVGTGPAFTAAIEGPGAVVRPEAAGLPVADKRVGGVPSSVDEVIELGEVGAAPPDLPPEPVERRGGRRRRGSV